MRVELQVLSGDDSRWRECAIRLFARVAEVTDAFFARAIVDRTPDHITAGQIYELGIAPGPVLAGRWMGVPRHPVWLVWYGESYARAAAVSGEPGRSGAIVRTAEDPSATLALPALPDRFFRRSSGVQAGGIEVLVGPDQTFACAPELLAY
jgi:hypothetical protein